MIELSVSLASNGAARVPGYEQLVRLGYTKNRGVYRLAVSATGEWQGLNIRAFWHTPGGDPSSSLVVDGHVDVPASVTAQPGNGCITFEGSDGIRTVTSADLHYRVAANSGTEDGDMPEPGTPAWEQLVDAVKSDATAAEQAKTDAQTAANAAAASAANAGQSARQAADSLKALKDGIANGDFKGEKGDKGDPGPVGPAGPQGERGEVGPTGATGATGPQGETGPRGEQGAQGIQGERGPQGEQGPKGDTGDTGPQGPKGDTGPAGADGKDGLDAPQIDDTAVTDSAPWSSKHIVDMLCPPLEETGNPVTCYPVAGYPLDCKVSWEPTQEGSGDPSPDNIRPIKGRDSVTMERCGGNLLDPERITAIDAAYGMTAQYVSEKNVISGIYDNVDTKASFNFMTLAHQLPGTSDFKAFDVKAHGCVLKQIRFADNTHTRIAIDLTDMVNGTEIALSFYLMAYVGSTPPTAYSPYTGQTVTLTLPHTIYGGSMDAVTGGGIEKCKLLTLTGTENWYIYGDKNIGSYAYTYTVPRKISDTLLCSHYKTIDWNGVIAGEAGYYPNTKYFQDIFTLTGFSSVDDWKAYLAAQYAAGTPVQITYKLETPTPFTVTGAQPIPALSGVNTVFTDSDSVTVTGRADPIKRITDLEDAVASMT